MAPATRIGRVADAAAEAAHTWAKDQENITHGHVIVLAHSPDHAGTGETNTACIAGGFSGDTGADGLDVTDHVDLITTIAAHLAELIERTGVTGVNVLVSEGPHGQG